MKKVELGKTGVEVSQLCLGCMIMGTTTDKNTSYNILDQFLDQGGNFLDTANCYAWWIGKGEYNGHESETLLGEWMKERGSRDKVFLATKVGGGINDLKNMRDPDGNIRWERIPEAYEHLSPSVIRRGIEGSLRRLQTDHIDLYYTHIEDRITPLEDILGTLNDLVLEGKVRHIACSNLRTWRLERARQISARNGWASFVAWQQEYSYLRPKNGADLGISVHVDDEELDYLKANPQVSLLAYSPLLKGIYDDPVKREQYYNWWAYNTDDSRARLKVLDEIARELGVSNNQLVMAWLLHHRPTVIPILAASRLSQFEQNMQALSIRLTDEQMQRLNAASA